MLKPVYPIAPHTGGGGPLRGVPVPGSNPRSHCLLFRKEGGQSAQSNVGGLVVDKIIGSGHFGVGSVHLTQLVLKLDRPHEVVLRVRNIDPEAGVPPCRVQSEAARRAQVGGGGEVLGPVDQEAVVSLEDGHQGLEDGGEGVHGVGGAPHQPAPAPGARAQAVQELGGARPSLARQQDGAHGEAVGPHQLGDRGLLTEGECHYHPSA